MPQAMIDKLLAKRQHLSIANIPSRHQDLELGSRLDTPIFQIYSDRFEVTSFGGLVEGLTLEKFYEGTSMPRNREIMRIFKDLEFVEQLGSGIPKIVDKYGRNVISVSENVVQATLAFDCDMGEKHPQKTTQKIIDALAANSSATRKELAEITGISEDGIKWNLDKLRKEGRIKRIGPDKGGHWEIIKNLTYPQNKALLL